MTSSDATDAEIIERSWEDPHAFAVIFDRHYDAIHRFLWARAGDGADDLASEVFRVAFERRRAYDPAYASAKPWLFGIGANLVRQHHRSRSRRWELRSRLGRARQRDVEASPEQRLHELAPSSAVAAALMELPPRDRDVLLLHAWGDLDYAETARALDVPVGTVRSRLHRARRALRGRLGSPRQAASQQAPGEGSTHG